MGEFVEVACEHVEHLTGFAWLAAPESVHGDAVEQGAQSLRLMGGITTVAELTCVDEDRDSGPTPLVDGGAEPDRGGAKVAVGEREHAELDLRDQLCTTLSIEREQLGEKVIDECPTCRLQGVDPRGRPLLYEGEAVLTKRVLSRERASERGRGDAGIRRHVAHREACEPVALQHPQRRRGDLRAASGGVDSTGHADQPRELPERSTAGLLGQIV